MRRDRCESGWEGCNRKAVGCGSALDLGKGRISLKRCEVVGESFPSHLCEVSSPAEGDCVGLKSEVGEAEAIKSECDISVAPSTGAVVV